MINSIPLPPFPFVMDSTLAPNGAIVFDNSTLEKLRCPRELMLSWLLRRNKVSNAAGRNFGSGMHIGLATRYEHCGSNPIDEATTLLANDKMKEWFDKSPAPGNDFRNFNHAQKYFKVYNEFYRMEDWGILRDSNGKRLVEKSFLLPFGFEVDGHPLYYAGKIDLGVEDRASYIWSHDHKTAFQFGQEFDLQMAMDGAQIGYCWALWQITGKRPAGYVIDAMRVRKPTKKSEYDPNAAPIDYTDFKRMPFPIVDDKTYEIWKQDVREMVTMIMRFYKRGYFPAYRWNCVKKFGVCDFYDACSAQPAEQANILLNSGLYEEATWSPLNLPHVEV